MARIDPIAALILLYLAIVGSAGLVLLILAVVLVRYLFRHRWKPPEEGTLEKLIRDKQEFLRKAQQGYRP